MCVCLCATFFLNGIGDFNYYYYNGPDFIYPELEMLYLVVCFWILTALFKTHIVHVVL